METHMRGRVLVDKLTGVLTRDALSDIEAAFGSRPEGEPWSVIMVDIDDFKMINDVHGHLAGDRVLQQIAWLLVRGVRDADQVIRFGGDEFLVVLPATSTLQAANVAQRFIGDVSAEAFQNGMKVGASVGLAESEASERVLSSIIGKADQALYDSKASGKSRMSFFREEGIDRKLSFEHFIDRQPQLKLLRSALDDVLSEGGRVILITGEPGVGKSRLVEELRHYCNFRSCAFARAKYDQPGSAGPFCTVAEAVCEVVEALPLEKRQVIADSVGSVLHETSMLFPPLPLKVSTKLNPPEWARGRLFYSQFGKVLSELSSLGPMVFFIDDIQWGHGQDFDLLGYLVRNANKARVLFIFTMQTPVELHTEAWGWMKGLLSISRSERLDLQPLEQEQITNMILLALGDPAVPQELIRRLSESSGGNPFYVRELLKSLQQRGSIGVDERGRRTYSLGSDIPLPRGIELLAKSRLDLLGEESRSALRMGSLLSGGFRLLDLAFLTEAAPMEVARRLEEPIRMELVHETPIDSSEQDYVFRFSSDCVRKILLEELPGALRQHLYTRLAAHFEEQFRNGQTGLLQQVAFCYYEGLERAKAVEYAALAAEDARRRQATFDQEMWLERYTAMAESSGKASAQELLEAWRELGRLYILHVRLGKAEDALRRASSYALASADLGSISALRASLFAERFEYDRALEEYERALATDMPLDQQLHARIRTAFIWHRQGATDVARSILDDVGARLEGVEEPHQRARLEAYFRSTYGTLLSQSGDGENGLPMCREALDFFESAGDLLNKARAQRFLAGILSVFPAWEERLRLLKSAEATFKEAGDVQSLMAAYMDLGGVHLELNQTDVADEEYLKCLDLAEACGSGARVAGSELGLGESCMQRGDYQAATEHFDRAAAGGRATGFLPAVGAALAGKARSLSAMGRISEAEAVVTRLESDPEVRGPAGTDHAPFLFARGMVSYHSSVPGEKEPLEQALVHFHGARKLLSERNLVDSLELLWYEALCLRELHKERELADLADEAGCLVDLSLTAIESPLFRSDFRSHRFVEGILEMRQAVGDTGSCRSPKAEDEA
jgi:diguanylate cyclase (GGDEF)-like protein